MRLSLLGAALVLLGLSPSVSAQAPASSPRSTVVLPSHPGEALRVTTADRQPLGPGRLAARYRGLRAYRDGGSLRRSAVPATPVAPVLSTAGGAFVRRHGSYFPVVPGR